LEIRNVRTWTSCSLAAGRQTGCISESRQEYVELKAKESKTGKIKLLLDTGADICLIKSSALLETTEFNPRKKVKVKSLDGKNVVMDGTVELRIYNGDLI
jgi:hypothetical protein